MATKTTEPDPISAVVFAPFRLVWRAVLGAVLLWFLSCAIQVANVRMHNLDPAPHMEGLIDYYMGQAAGQNVWVTKIAEKGYYFVFEATEAQRRFFASPMSGRSTMNLGENTRKLVWVSFKPDILVIGYATLLFGIKLGIALLAGALIFVMLVAAGVDGLVQRSIRRSCAGNESAAIYHRAKHIGLGLLPWGMGVLHLCIPVPIDPGWIFVPGGVMLAILARFQATYYKKYL